MRPVTAILLFALLSLSHAEETTKNDYNDRANTVEPQPSVRLDPYIRKALLKALSDLEDGNNVTDFETTDGDETSPLNTEQLSTGNDVSVTQANKENIQIHSFLVNGQSAFANASNTSPTFIDSNISILSSTAGNVESHVTATLPTQTSFSEIFQTRETSSNVQQTRSIQSTPKQEISNGEKHPIYKPQRISTTSVPTTITTTTTTTTTPKPTHNEDGENIEDVAKKDVQVFQAPLVAAFTVQQDANGIPKRVFPIYQQINNNDIAKLSNLPTNVVAPELLPPKTTSSNFLNIPPTQFISHHLTLQKQLEEKQRILEEQLRYLQFQQRQQEELLRNQQLLLQQKEAQRLQQSLFEQEQLKRQQVFSEQQKLVRLNNNLHNNKHLPQNQVLNGLRPQKPHVSIQSSIALDQTNAVGAQQQLPNKEAVDFLLHLRKQQSDQFPLQENHLPQGIGNFLQPNPPQNNRVFRHESGVGNLGINNHNYNTFSHGFPNRFLPVNQFSSDNELKQLLSQTRLHPRAHEDLNIVTKVLSLNHGVPINNNRLTFDSRRHSRPF